MTTEMRILDDGTPMFLDEGWECVADLETHLRAYTEGGIVYGLAALKHAWARNPGLRWEIPRPTPAPRRTWADIARSQPGALRHLSALAREGDWEAIDAANRTLATRYLSWTDPTLPREWDEATKAGYEMRRHDGRSEGVPLTDAVPPAEQDLLDRLLDEMSQRRATNGIRWRVYPKASGQGLTVKSYPPQPLTIPEYRAICEWYRARMSRRSPERPWVEPDTSSHRERWAWDEGDQGTFMHEFRATDVNEIGCRWRGDFGRNPYPLTQAEAEVAGEWIEHTPAERLTKEQWVEQRRRRAG